MAGFTAEVVDIRQETTQPPRWQLLLTETAFTQAESRGTLEAVAPSGIRLIVPVLDVVAVGPDLWHVVSKPLGPGTAVTGSVHDAAVPEA